VWVQFEGRRVGLAGAVDEKRKPVGLSPDLSTWNLVGGFPLERSKRGIAYLVRPYVIENKKWWRRRESNYSAC
jgi:hypothetical protein